MSYSELSALLDPQQFKQMEVVRAYLMQDPTGLDKAPAGPPTTLTEKADGAT